MDATTPDQGPALLRWLNSFDLSEELKSWTALQDGRILWQVLRTVEPDYFLGDLPEGTDSTADNWIPRWQNLKHINRAVMSFIIDECGKLQALGKKMNPDLKAIAIDGSAKPTIEFVKLILLAAMYSPHSNQQMIRVMEKLGPKVAIPIATCIGAVESADQQLLAAEAMERDGESDSRRGSSPEAHDAAQIENLRRDPELEQEEKLIRAHAGIRDLEEKNKTLKEHYDKQAETLRTIQEELEHAQRRLQRAGSDPDRMDETNQKMIQERNQDKQYIQELESQLENYAEEAAGMERKLERLTEDSESKQAVRDQMQILRVERDELAQKAKAAENLKKKIQSLQESDKSNMALREDLEAAQAEIRGMQKVKDRYSKLHAENEERKKTLATIEQDMYDQNNKRKRLEREHNVLQQQYETVKNQRTQDQETIQEQEARIKDLEVGQGLPVDLERESIERDGESDAAPLEKLLREIKARNAELEEEIFQLRDGMSGAEEASIDNKNLQMMRERFEKLEKKYLDTYQENLGLDASLKDIGEDIGDSRPFLEMRERLKDATEKSVQVEQRASDLEAQLSEVVAKLTAANSKLSAVDKTQSDALDELKQSIASETDTLQTEISRLSTRTKTLENDLFESKSLLRHSLLNANALAREDATTRASNEANLVAEQLKLLIAGAADAEDVAAAISKRIEDARTGESDAKAATSEMRTAHEAHVEDLERRLRDAEAENDKLKEEIANAPPPALPTNTANDEETRARAEQTAREHALMTTAWYDLSSRIQSDAVVVARRGVAEAPKSFLNKQRRLVAASPSASASGSASGSGGGRAA